MNPVPTGYCNPLNLSYRFQIRGWGDVCHREAADPSVVLYRDEYWLFPSKSGGYWHSTNLRDWRFIATSVLPTEDYAPDVRVINGKIYFTASREGRNCPIYCSTNPAADEWVQVSDPLVYMDPNMFQDDDGRVYLFYGCSNKKPICGVEMDPQTMTPIGEPVPVIHENTAEHGWERGREDNLGDVLPWIEGVWMTKQNGVYYLQYAAPGTEWNVYGDGVYTSSAPLGPYRYAAHNPFSFKPGGFITGAGHGSTFPDVHGNLWHIATMRISVKHQFERRIGLFPAGFDAEGLLFCNTNFGDYPIQLPTGRWDPWQDPFPGWMLLSYKKPVTASTALSGHEPALAVNENIRDYWSAASGAPGEWLQVDLGNLGTVHAVQINFAEEGVQSVRTGRGAAPAPVSVGVVGGRAGLVAGR